MKNTDFLSNILICLSCYWLYYLFLVWNVIIIMFQHVQGVDHLVLAKKVFVNDVVDNVRHFTWYKVTLYSPVSITSSILSPFSYHFHLLITCLLIFFQSKQEMMYVCICYLVKLLGYLSQFDPLFSYVPECYPESVIDSFHALRRGDPPFVFVEGNDIIIVFLPLPMYRYNITYLFRVPRSRINPSYQLLNWTLQW